MNVCGLRSKLLIPEFISYINQCDVVALSETKLDDLDEIVVPNFECVTKNRKQKTARKSGGIAVLIKNDILKHFSVVDSECECEYVLWFTLSKAIFGTGADVLFGAVYIPPENSRYNSEGIMEQFYFEVDENSRSFKHLIMMGDFNARTSNIADFAEIDEVIFDQINVDPEDFFVSVPVDEITSYGFSVKRTSQDGHLNKFGKMLIESCKYNEMIILNGRSFCDKDIGRNTCKNSSVVDYVLSSLNTSKYLSYFNIAEFCELFSDAHCPVELV